MGLSSISDNIVLNKIKIYISESLPFESYASKMKTTIVYLAYHNNKEIYISCVTNVVFPVLVRTSDEYGRISLLPYIYSVEVYASDSLEELMNIYPIYDDVFYENESFELELFKSSLFMLQLYELDTDDKRCIMQIDDGSNLPRFSINIDDLINYNIMGMYSFRPYLI